MSIIWRSGGDRFVLFMEWLEPSPQLGPRMGVPHWIAPQLVLPKTFRQAEVKFLQFVLRDELAQRHRK